MTLLRRSLRSAVTRSTCALVLGGSMILTGCDPTIRSTVEDGIITSSTAFLGSAITALFNAASNAAA